MIIEKGHPLWQRLYDEYIANPKAGYVSLGGNDYRVLNPEEGVIKFLPISGLDKSYSSLSL